MFKGFAHIKRLKSPISTKKTCLAKKMVEMSLKIYLYDTETGTIPSTHKTFA